MKVDVVSVHVHAGLDVIHGGSVLGFQVYDEDTDGSATFDRFLHDEVQHHGGVLAAREGNVDLFASVEGVGDAFPRSH